MRMIGLMMFSFLLMQPHLGRYVVIVLIEMIYIYYQLKIRNIRSQNEKECLICAFLYYKT